MAPPSIRFYHLILLSIGTSLLLFLSWFPLPATALIFLAWIPLLALENLFYTKRVSGKLKFFFFIYLTFLLWNLFTTWWISKASLGGAIMAITANSLLMCLPFALFHYTRIKRGDFIGYISFPVYWVSFEFFHFNWDLSWPWLTLGNSLSPFYAIIQWYEFTGVLGGSLWILIINTFLFHFIKNVFTEKGGTMYYIFSRAVIFSFILDVPIFVSLVRYYTYTETIDPVNFVLIQPNIDPYNEKFADSGSERYISPDKQLFKLLKMSRLSIDSSTHYAVWPETAIPEGMFIEDMSSSAEIHRMKQLVSDFPQLKIISGLMLYDKYSTANKTSTARKLSGAANTWYDAFNSSILIEHAVPLQIHHKSKLVPGVEIMPYPEIFKILEPLAINLGGTIGSLGREKKQNLFITKDSMLVIPVICYESIFGDYLSKYVKMGAEFIVIITNDGWWGNTPGYKQHLELSKLRAVETRRSIARCANTGISCFINQRGDILIESSWWAPGVLKHSVNKNKNITIYARFGDYVGRIASVLSFFFFFSALIKKIKSNPVLPIT